jgi:hypothetical protein
VYYFRNGEIRLVGINIAHNSTRSFFSPVGGIETDLDVTPVLDWNPWNDYTSSNGSYITSEEWQAAANCWVNDIPAPGTGEEVTTTRLQMLVYFCVNDLPCKQSSSVTISSPSKSEPYGGEIATASRMISGDAKNSMRFSVTVEMKASEDLIGLLLDEDIPIRWTVTPVNNDGAVFKPSTNEWIWKNLPEGETHCVIYEIIAPEGKTGVSWITGNVSAFGATDIMVTGDSKIAG